jgi:Kinesin motor domain
VIFNSIEGLHSDGRVCHLHISKINRLHLIETFAQYRPVRLHGIELADPSDTKHPPLNLDVPTSEPALAQVLAEHLSTTSLADTDIDPTVLKLDRNHEYSIWLSYAEVYNERAYDLLESVNNIEHEKEMQQPTTKSGLPRPAPHNSHAQSQSHPLLLTRKALPVKPSPASDTGTPTSSGKYIAGLRQFRVHSASQAKRLLKLGQLHRRVFGTLANSQSSRSHGLVTIKVVRGHRGERDVCAFCCLLGLDILLNFFL